MDALTGPVEFPLPSVADLRKCQASMPWIFARDYQHTGMNKELTAAHADRIADVMAEVAAEMADLPEHFTRFQCEMADLYQDKPWTRADTWTETR